MTDFIAEISSNHNGQTARALALIDKAAEIGCTAVKFQLFRMDKLYTPEVLAHSRYRFLERRRAWELPLEWLPLLAQHSHANGLKFGCTPFYPQAVSQLVQLVDFFKIASYNLLDLNLIKLIAATGKPVILSTGMGHWDEIITAIDALHGNGCSQLTILYCVSKYPCQPTDLNLSEVTHLRRAAEIFGDGCGLGWSDHSASPGIIYRMVIGERLNTVEFHLDLDGAGWEYDIGHCWLPEQMRGVISAINEAARVGYRATPTLRGQVEPVQDNEKFWRADPGDGLRPLKEIRGGF